MNTVLSVYQDAAPIIWLVLPIIGGIILAEMKRRGYQTTYIEALGRAVGKGVLAAQDKGLDPLSAAGRLVLTATAVEYLRTNVGDAAAKLGIKTEADHLSRVEGELGSSVIRSGALSVSGMLTGPKLQGGLA